MPKGECPEAGALGRQEIIASTVFGLHVLRERN
jgi:hypothetical protein